MRRHSLGPVERPEGCEGGEAVEAPAVGPHRAVQRGEASEQERAVHRRGYVKGRCVDPLEHSAAVGDGVVKGPNAG